MENPTLQWGKKYISLGWSIIPVRAKSKEPLIKWEKYQNQRATLVELQEWLTKWPKMNLGVITGYISGIVVVDLDGLDGLNFGLKQKIVSTVIAKTGNGTQLFYKWTKHVDNSVKKIASGVDIRGDGGFVVVPPSIHPNGKIYQWERFVPEYIIGLPTGVLSSAQKEKNIPNLSNEPDWIAHDLEDMKDGNRDNTLFRICSKLRNSGYSAADTRILLFPHAEKAGAVNILESKIENVWNRYESKSMAMGTGILQSSIYRNSQNELSVHSPDNDDSYNKYTSNLLESRYRYDELQTGFPTLDKYFEGGLKSERLFTIAARTGTGKTNFAIALSANLCQQGKKVLFFSTEFKYEKIWARYVATLQRKDDFRKHMLYVCDSFSPNIIQVEEAIKKIMPDVFIFDHINHLGDERENLGQFMLGCNFLQRKYNCQGIMVAQLNRQADWVEDGKRIEPRMSMIKGSGTIEQASSRVLLLSETRITPEMCEILGVLDKNDSGERGLINFALLKNPFKFVEL